MGRPKKEIDEAYRGSGRLTIAISEELLDLIRPWATLEDRTLADMCRVLIKRGLAQSKAHEQELRQLHGKLK